MAWLAAFASALLADAPAGADVESPEQRQAIVNEARRRIFILENSETLKSALREGRPPSSDPRAVGDAAARFRENARVAREASALAAANSDCETFLRTQARLARELLLTAGDLQRWGLVQDRQMRLDSELRFWALAQASAALTALFDRGGEGGAGLIDERPRACAFRDRARFGLALHAQQEALDGWRVLMLGQPGINGARALSDEIRRLEPSFRWRMRTRAAFTFVGAAGLAYLGWKSALLPGLAALAGENVALQAVAGAVRVGFWPAFGALNMGYAASEYARSQERALAPNAWAEIVNLATTLAESGPNLEAYGALWREIESHIRAQSAEMLEDIERVNARAIEFHGSIQAAIERYRLEIADRMQSFEPNRAVP